MKIKPKAVAVGLITVALVYALIMNPGFIAAAVCAAFSGVANAVETVFTSIGQLVA